jgi:hypothetical protein
LPQPLGETCISAFIRGPILRRGGLLKIKSVRIHAQELPAILKKRLGILFQVFEEEDLDMLVVEVLSVPRQLTPVQRHLDEPVDLSDGLVDRPPRKSIGDSSGPMRLDSLKRVSDDVGDLG